MRTALSLRMSECFDTQNPFYFNHLESPYERHEHYLHRFG